MIRTFLQRTMLFSLIITVATPVQAFWGKDKLFQWANEARSYAAQVYERPQEHKAAIAAVCGVGLFAVAAIGAYNLWGGSRTEGQPGGEQPAPSGGGDNSASLPGSSESTTTPSSDNVGSSSNVIEGNQTEGQSEEQRQAEQQRLRHEAEMHAAAEERAMQEYLAQLTANERALEEEKLRLQEEEFLREAYGEVDESLPKKPAADQPMSKKSATSNVEKPQVRDTLSRLDSSDSDSESRVYSSESDSEEDEQQEESERLERRPKWLEVEVKPLTREEIEALEEQERFEEERKRLEIEQRLRDEEEGRARELQYKRELEEAQRLANEQARLLHLAESVHQDFMQQCGRAPTNEEIVDLTLEKDSSEQLYQTKLYEYKTAEACKCLTGASLSPEQLYNFAPSGAWINLIRNAGAKRAEVQKKEEEERAIHERWIQKCGFNPFESAPSTSSSSASSSRSPSPESEPLSGVAQGYMVGLGSDAINWPKEMTSPLEAFRALDPEVQQEILNHLRVRLNDGNALPVSRSEKKTGIFAWVKGLFSRNASENEEQFKEYYTAVRDHALLAVPMHTLEQKHAMSADKKIAIGALLEEALLEAQTQTDFMGISGSSIKYMEEDPNRKLHFKVRILKPSQGFDTGKVALFVPIHGTFANSGPYGSGTDNYDNGPRLMAAAQRMADAKGVTLHVIIPNWNSDFKEHCREEAACYILPLIQKWYTDNMAKDIAFIDLLGHSEGNSVITLMLKGIANRELKKHIRWLSVCPTAGSDYIPIGCKARVTMWSPADALAFIASVTRFMTYRKQSDLNRHIESLFMNISLSYNGVPENHVTAKYRACALYDVVFDIAERFKGHCELSMDFNEPHKEILVAARRGKEACLQTFDETRKDILEQVSLQAEERYRALYPDKQTDWHEKPHDWATFALRYPQHGTREKADDDAEDAAIAAAGQPCAVQAELYQRAHHEASGRIHYGWHETYAEPLPIALMHDPFLFRDAQRTRRDIARENKVDLGDFVYQVLIRGDLGPDRDALVFSDHRKEFISALIEYFDVIAPREDGYANDVFRISDSEYRDLYRFITEKYNEKIGQSSIGVRNDGNPVPADDYRIFVHGLPRDNDHIIVTPISDQEFLLKLGKTVPRSTIVYDTTASLAKSAGSSFYAAAAAAGRLISRTPSPAPVQTFPKDPHSCAVTIPEYILRDFEIVLNARHPLECKTKHVLRERARLGGVCEINAMLGNELHMHYELLPHRSNAALGKFLENNRLQLGDERLVRPTNMATIFKGQHNQEIVKTYLVKRRMIGQPQVVAYGGFPSTVPICSSSNLNG